jgi:chromosome segregation ATPase
MEDKLARLEEQMRKLIAGFHSACEKNEGLRRENEQLHNDLMEKSRQLEVLEERSLVLMETQEEKKRLQQQREQIRKETMKLLEKVRALKGNQDK